MSLGRCAPRACPFVVTPPRKCAVPRLIKDVGPSYILSATRIDCDLPITTKSRSKGALAKTPQLSMSCTARAFVERANRARDAGVKTKRPAMALVVLGAPYTWPGMGLLLCPYRPGVSSSSDAPPRRPQSTPVDNTVTAQTSPGVRFVLVPGGCARDPC